MTEIFDEEKNLSLDTKFNQLKNWDSLKKLILLSVIDENYKIMLNDIEKMSSFKDIYDFINSKNKNNYMSISSFNNIKIVGIAGTVPKLIVNNLNDHPKVNTEEKKQFN